MSNQIDSSNGKAGSVAEEKYHEPINGESLLWPKVKPFVNAGLAGLTADTLVILKNGFILSSTTAVSKQFKVSNEATEAFRKLIANEKAKNMRSLKEWKCMAPVNTLARASGFGVFELLREKLAAANDGKPLTVYQEAGCGACAGAATALISNPLYTVVYQMQADAIRPSAAQPFSYRNIFFTTYRIAAIDGVFGLWKKASANLKAYPPLYMGLLAPYYPSKNYFKVSQGFGEYAAQLGAGAVSGFSFITLQTPIQNVLMAQQQNPNTSFLFCTKKILQLHGVSGLYGRYFSLLGGIPYFMIMWITLEGIQKFQKNNGL